MILIFSSESSPSFWENIKTCSGNLRRLTIDEMTFSVVLGSFLPRPENSLSQILRLTGSLEWIDLGNLEFEHEKSLQWMIEGLCVGFKIKMTKMKMDARMVSHTHIVVASWFCHQFSKVYFVEILDHMNQIKFISVTFFHVPLLLREFAKFSLSSAKCPEQHSRLSQWLNKKDSKDTNSY